MNFRDKARETYAQGVAERGNFTPSGAPLKVYQSWLRNTNRAPRRENFCHYWRVVAIWAPLAFLRLNARKVADMKYAPHITGAALALALIYASITFGTVLNIIGIALAAVAIVALGIGIGFAVHKLWRSSWTSWFDRNAEIIFGAFLGLTILTMVVVVSVTAIVNLGVLAFLGIVLATALSLTVLIFGISKLATYLEGHRAEKRAERNRIIEEWLESGEGEYPFAHTPREPGKIYNFFSGLVDFLILAFQVVRVKKWKICPTVEVPEK